MAVLVVHRFEVIKVDLNYFSHNPTTCQNSHDRHSARLAASVGRKAPNFSAR